MRSPRTAFSAGQCTRRAVVSGNNGLRLTDRFPLIRGAVVEELTYVLASSSLLGSNLIDEILNRGFTTSSSCVT